MANFNNAAYLDESIRSVRDQTWADWELVIVDDASTDQSMQVIEKYSTDSRIRVFQNEANQGYLATMVRLFDLARAPVLGTLDSDDALEPQAIEAILQAHAQHPDCGFLYSQHTVCDAKMRPLRAGYCRQLPPGKTLMSEDCASHFRTFKAQYYRRTPGFDLEIYRAEDKDILMKMEEVGGVAFLDAPLYRYRLLAQSESHGRNRAYARSSHALAIMRADSRRQHLAIESLSKPMLRMWAHYGLGTSLRVAKFGRAGFFLARILRYGGPSIWGVRRFVDGCQGRD